MLGTRRHSLTISLIRLALVVITLAMILGSQAQRAQAVSANVVISQVYGGGGNSGATYKNDFIELFNRGTSAVDLTGWTVQYASTTGTSWQKTDLTGSIASGKYYLVKEAQGAGGTVNLPTPDITGTIPMAAGAAKVALLNSSAVVTSGTGCPSGANVIDLVGYGGTTNCFEGSGPAATLSNTMAAFRDANGCVDTDNNAADFAAGFPAPRNSASPLTDCTLPPPPQVHIHDIQGTSQISPKNGSTVFHVPGIVTAVRSNGFYLQDPNPDADPATSEGIFVFTSSAPTIHAGDDVKVNGLVTEFRPGGSSSKNLTTTEIGSPSIVLLSSGNNLPAPVLVGTGGRVPPSQIFENDTSSCGNVELCNFFDPSQDGIDFWESLEGMLVQFNNPVAVGPASFNVEIPIVGDMGAHAALRTPRGGLIVQSGSFNPERVILNNAINSSFLTKNVNVGDYVSGSIVGVMDYNFGNFFFETVAPVTFTSGGLTRETTAAQGTNEVAVGTFNVENLSPNDPSSKFSNLAGLIVQNLKSPDIIGVEEIQDNSGVVDSGVVDATTTWTMLVNAISAAGGPTYQFRQINPVDDKDGGVPGGNIRQGFLFRTDRGLSFVDRACSGCNLSTDAVSVLSAPGGPQLSWSPGRIAPQDLAWKDSRKPLVGEFLFRGHHFFVIANHFASKSGDDPLMGKDQPPIEASKPQRMAQAQVEHNFVQQLLSLDANADVVVVGDLNDFQFSDPVKTLTGASVGSVILKDLIDTLSADERYSYVFEGNSETLDHILMSNHLVNSNPFVEDVVHVNSEFFDQASDHEPQVDRIAFNANVGFVTGGGWIASPLNAYAPSPLLTGKATFQFDAKYDKGAGIPTGSTQFAFGAANFLFVSTSYDWLISSGGQAQLQGTGTVNGSGSFRFLLSVTDGQTDGGTGDMLRIKILDKTTGNVVYDSQPGAPDVAAPTLAIGGGNIILHVK